MLFDTHMMDDKVGENTRPRLEGACGVVVPWGTFRQTFLEMYFSEDVNHRKDMEFLKLKQGSMTVEKHAARFENLVQMCEVHKWSPIRSEDDGG